MTQPVSSALSRFQLAASELRRDRADLDATLQRLENLRAETDKIIAESKARIARSLLVLEHGPSLVPEQGAGPSPAE